MNRFNFIVVEKLDLNTISGNTSEENDFQSNNKKQQQNREALSAESSPQKPPRTSLDFQDAFQAKNLISPSELSFLMSNEPNNNDDFEFNIPTNNKNENFTRNDNNKSTSLKNKKNKKKDLQELQELQVAQDVLEDENNKLVEFNNNNVVHEFKHQQQQFNYNNCEKKDEDSESKLKSLSIISTTKQEDSVNSYTINTKKSNSIDNSSINIDTNLKSKNKSILSTNVVDIAKSKMYANYEDSDETESDNISQTSVSLSKLDSWIAEKIFLNNNPKEQKKEIN